MKTMRTLLMTVIAILLMTGCKDECDCDKIMKHDWLVTETVFSVWRADSDYNWICKNNTSVWHYNVENKTKTEIELFCADKKRHYGTVNPNYKQTYDGIICTLYQTIKYDYVIQ